MSRATATARTTAPGGTGPGGSAGGGPDGRSGGTHPGGTCPGGGDCPADSGARAGRGGTAHVPDSARC
ncbi:hypothetical protein OG912_08415 [Streptomyces sp. NBC_00464]|uniref:hypothetical protein n=1 Tax=Streptomyces sp. NBC_00464 TaxID=2975751 RepID=UPI002E17C85B